MMKEINERKVFRGCSSDRLVNPMHRELGRVSLSQLLKWSSMQWLVRRQRLHLQAKRLRVLPDDGGGKKARHVEHVFVAKGLVQFAAIGGESTDATPLVLIVDKKFQVPRGFLFASVICQQRQCLLHGISLELFQAVAYITRCRIRRFPHVQRSEEHTSELQSL